MDATKQLEKKIDTRIDKAVSDISGVIQDFATHVDRRFDGVETELSKLQKDMQSVLKRLDSIEKDISISDDERVVMGMQLNRLHDWVEQAAKRIGVEFVR